MKIGERDINRRMVAVLTVVVIFIALCATLAPYGLNGYGDNSMVYLRKGMTQEQVSDSLRSALGEKFGNKVDNLIRWTGTDLSNRQGAFKVRRGDCALKVFHHLRSGAVSGVKFTFNNVRTRQEWAELVGKTFMMSSDEMLAAMADSALCDSLGHTPEDIICLLLPDTYEFYWDITPSKLLHRMAYYYNLFWDDKRKQQAQALGLTPDQVQIIASIAEEETAKPDERGKVGRLYINRFKKGMPLQADPTVKFALGDFSIKRITVEMTKTQSPYNTYYVQGLPPAPIRLAEKATIDAVLGSEAHDYIYMCAKEDFSGYHNFTNNYTEHLANGRRYRAALDAKGIK